jgi:transcription antitermination factor NusG
MGELLEVTNVSCGAQTVERLGDNLLTCAADASPAWHALYTRYQHEKVTARILTDKGFEVFLPLYSASHRWKDRMKQLSLPLFPCYIFIRGGLDRRLEILSTPGAHSLVRSCDQFAVIPEQEIEAVRQVVGVCLRAEPHPFMKCGDRVRVKSGPLAGIEGILFRRKDQFKLILSVELLHRSIAVEVDGAAVEPMNRGGIATEQRVKIGLPAYA